MLFPYLELVPMRSICFAVAALAVAAPFAAKATNIDPP